MSGPLVLGIESSCDETSAALLRGTSDLLGHVILSQDLHRVYGGVVPELAARAHLAVIDDVVDEVMNQARLPLSGLDAVGVTVGPGLIGPLLVGVCWAKSLSFALARPLVGVHHMEAHLFAPSLEDPEAVPPFVALLVSGGHTLLLYATEWGRYRLLGETRDDAAGEAFDKVAKLLGLPYPGGPHVEALARTGEQGRYRFPRPMLRSDQDPSDAEYFDFSFSGLKTAVVQAAETVRARGELEREKASIARAFQDAVVDVLVSKTIRAVEATGCARVLIGGGVSANSGLRSEMPRRLGPGARVFHASPRLSLDNGAMVARTASFRLANGDASTYELTADAAMPFPVYRYPVDSSDSVVTIVHGSDLHFGRPHDPGVAEAFLAASWSLSPDLLVLSGDFTQRAKVREYRQARAYLDRLPSVPRVVTPGNHDVPLYRVFERIFDPYRNYRAHIREELDGVTRVPGLTVVSLNSAAPRSAIVNGRISPRQLEFARHALRGAPAGDLKAIVAHHHLSPAPDYEGDTPLPRASEILEAFEAMGVELVMGGHLHRSYIGSSLDVRPGADPERGVVIVQSGTTTSRRGRARERAKNSFNVIRLAPDQLEVTHYMHFRGAGFEPLAVHVFPRLPRLWLGSAARTP